MSHRDNRDIQGQIENVPMRTRRDTTGHPPLGGVPVSRPVPLASPAGRQVLLAKSNPPAVRAGERHVEQRSARSLSPADQVRSLSRRVGRLWPSWRDPERYFEDRSEIEADLRRLARVLEEWR